MTAATQQRLPLSTAQRGIWLGQQLAPESPAYWTAELVELIGTPDERALERALRTVVEECETLRSTFHADASELFREVHPAIFELRRVDSSRESSPFDAALEWLRCDLAEPVNLERPLFAATLLRLDAARHVLCLRAHHIALDGYAFGLLQKRLAELYAAFEQERAPRPSTARALADIVREDQAYRASPAFQRDAEFWRLRLQTAPAPALVLPAAELAPTVAKATLVLPDATARWLKARAVADGMDVATWFIAFASAWLATVTGSKEQTLGLPVAARFGSVGASTPCMMMNIAPLQVTLRSGESFSAHAGRVASELKAMRPHVRYRYEDLKQDLACAATGRRLFGAVINVMPFDKPADFGSLRAVVHPLASGPVEDLAINFLPRETGSRLALEGNPNAYTPELLELLLASLVAGLHDVLGGTAQFSDALTVSSELREALAAAPHAWAHIAGPPLCEGARDVLRDIERFARTTPTAVAIEQSGHCSLSYAELMSRVRRLSRALSERGAGPEHRVALLLPRSPDAIVAQLAVLHSGAAYVPLDPQGPSARIAHVLDDAEPLLVLTKSEHAPLAGAHPLLLLNAPSDTLPDEVSAEAAGTEDGDRLAYIIYTSGSTGRPNGVMIERAALAHFVAGARQRYAMQPSDRVLQFAPLQFDASVEEIFVTLTSGATLVLRTDDMLETVGHFLREAARLSLTVLDLPTAFWHELTLELDRTPLPPSVRLTIIGGEAALAEAVARWRRAAPADSVLLNTYGPTETTVVCTTAILSGPGAVAFDSQSSPPIGRPLPGTEVFVVNAEREVAAKGDVGELCVAGPALARGYFGRHELSEARFVKLHALGQEHRVYLTGDRVRLSREGELTYVGRSDDELKISGHRVHPLEVEGRILAVSGVREAAVVAAGTAPKQHLAAFIVGEGVTETALRTALARELAPQAIPRTIHFVERLERDPNGKLDRKRLRQLASEHAPEGEPAPCARNGAASALQRLVLDVWQQVLRVPSLTADSDFFASGGHSLLALEVAHRLGRALSREVPLSTLYRYPTAAALAELLEASPTTSTDYNGQNPLAPLVVLAPGKSPPLVCVHPAGGLAWCYLGLSRHLPGVTLLGLQDPGFSGPSPNSFDAIVAHHLATLLHAQPEGPYRLLGWSSGGGIAHALAHQLEARDHRVAFVAMLDSFPADIWHGTPEPTELDALVSMLDDVDASPTKPNGEKYTHEELLARLKAPGSSLAAFDDATIHKMWRATHDSMRIYRTAKHAVIESDVLFFRAAKRRARAPEASTWSPYVQGRFALTDIDSTHLGMCEPQSLEAVAETLGSRLG